MKVDPAVLVVGCLSALALAGCTTLPTDSGTCQSPFTDALVGYQYCPPTGWTPVQYGAVTGFRAPSDSASTFSSSVNVVTTELPADVTLDQDVAHNKQALPQAVSDYRELSTVAATMGGQRAIQIEYTGTQSGNRLHWVQTFTIHASREYVFTYTAQDGQHEANRDTAATSLQSFRFLQGQGAPVQTPGLTPLTSQSAYQLDLSHKDLGLGWTRGEFANYTDATPGVRSAHKAEPDRDPRAGDPFDIATTVRVFDATASARAAFADDKQKVDADYSTVDSAVGDEAFAWQKAAPFVALEVRQGNVVWTVHFSGQAGYSWDPTLEEVGRILTQKYAA